MKKILLMSNQRKQGVQDAMQKFLPWLSERAEVVARWDPFGDEQLPKLTDSVDLVVVLGGDGTLLAAARELVERECDAPLVGINFGRVGFLAEFSMSEFQSQWTEMEQAGWPARDRLLLDARLLDATGEQLRQGYALNEVVVSAGASFRMVELGLDLEGGLESACLKGDGVVICTPSGSTAYNLSAGGPIMEPDAQVICVTPLNPHSLAFRSIALSADKAMRVRALTVHEGTHVVLDGGAHWPIEQGQSVEVVRAKRKVRMVSNPTRTYWALLTDKMHWAVRPRG